MRTIEQPTTPPLPQGSTGVSRVAALVAPAVLAVCALIAGGCSNSSEQSSDATAASTLDASGAAPPASEASAQELAALSAAVGDGGCDELDTTRCMLPFPSDRFTNADDTTETGRRVSLPSGQLANTSGETLDVTDWNRNDGFSPGSPMMAKFADLDPVASKLAPIGDIARSMADTSPSVVVDLTTGKRLAHWAEMDSNAPDGQQLLLLRGAAALPEGHRIGVAFRGLVNSSHAPVDPSAAFVAYRDNHSTTLDAIERRRPQMEQLFTDLAKAGITRADLQLAWSFTVASAQSIAGPMLYIRDDAFTRLGTAAPAFTVGQTLTDGLPNGIGRRVTGTFEVPLYLTGAGQAGERFALGADGLPSFRNAQFTANFTCQIPRKALDGPAGTTRPVVYGHGLMGSAGEAEGSQVAKNASTNDMMYCATDWIGMSSGDLPNALKILQSLSTFATLADRVQQGMLNTLFLARLMKHPDGFAANPAFASRSGATVLDTTEVYYDANSQGGIVGGAVTAVSTEWTKAVLGVPGMNYSTLLSRSVDFNQYFAVMRAAYPDAIDQMLIFGVLQMLWDRAETNGYAQHLTSDPYPGTPEHQVALHVAFGDHQVATVAAEVEARTIGARLHTPALAAGRHPDTQPFYGLEPPSRYPTSDSLLMYFDSGTLPPPSQNITPAASDEFMRLCEPLPKDQRDANPKCADSHEDPRRSPLAMQQKDEFFRPDGQLIDPCDSAPCTAPNHHDLDY